MKSGIIGADNVGRALGSGAAKKRPQVISGVRGADWNLIRR
jgi:hypothetical protein